MGNEAQCYSDDNFSECTTIKNAVDKLYNLGYRKIPEGLVVLSKEEYKQLYNDERASYYRAENLTIENDLLNRKLINARKETARYILKALYEQIDEKTPKWVETQIKMKAKQFGVEVE